MRALTALLPAVLALSACTGSNPVASVSPSAQISPAQTSPASDFPLSTVDLTCRLPVVTFSQAGADSTYAGGFITFPTAQYRADPNGVIRLRVGPGDLATDAAPVLYGSNQTGTPTYDLARRRWLPVGSGQEAPDGSSYAYSVPGATGADPTSVHVVTIATGADRVVSSNPPPSGAAVGWALADFDGTHAYLVGQQIDQFPGGLWRLDTLTGAVNQLSQARGVLLVRGGNAWAGVVNPADPSPPHPGKGQGFDSIVQIDLTTGAQTTWIYRPGSMVYLVGVDQGGHPVVSVAPGPDFDVSHQPLLVLDRPQDSGTLVSTAGQNLLLMQPDVDRIWFGNEHGIYLWTPTRGLLKVFGFQGDASLSQWIAPAGRCV
jgi:hypothetical protein